MEDFRLAETHVSVLVFTPTRVLKFKKPVTFEFVDLSRVADRLAACQMEVALNSRLAPDVYEGVGRLVGPDGSEEPVVVMKRLPESRSLTSLVGHAGNEAEQAVRGIARLLADFHRAARRGRDVDLACTARAVERLWSTNLAEMRRVAGRLIDPERIAEADILARAYFAGRDEAFARRIAAGRVVEGHGDLLCDDIFCLPDGPRVLDCLEFDPALRSVDTLHDCCSLACDLEDKGRPDLASTLLDEYRRAAGDAWPPSLAHLYLAYRAAVRAKVECLRSASGPEPEGRPARRLEQAIAHLKRARMRMVIVGGLPGTGKSTLAQSLHEVTGWPVLSSDVLRKRLAGMEPDENARASFGEGLYSAGGRATTYSELLSEAEATLSAGFSVVLDASWLRNVWREAARQVAAKLGTDLIEIRCVAPTSVATRRMVERRGPDRHGSDATPEIAELMAEAIEPWCEAAVIDTSTDLAVTTARVLAAVDEA